MTKTVIFSDLGYPAMIQPGPPDNHVIVSDDTALRLDDGRVLAPDGSYRWWLLGQPAFGGVDGRQAVVIPDDAALIGKGWDDLAALKSDEHPFGLLKEARPETAAEKKAREKAEAEAKAAEEAAAKATAEAEALEATAGRIITPAQFNKAMILSGLKVEFREALAKAGKTETEIEIAMADIEYAWEPMRFDNAKFIASAETLGKTEADREAFWQMAMAL